MSAEEEENGYEKATNMACGSACSADLYIHQCDMAWHWEKQERI